MNPQSLADLLPCHCGAASEIDWSGASEIYGHCFQTVTIDCQVCCRSVSITACTDTSAESLLVTERAITAWNTRAPARELGMSTKPGNLDTSAEHVHGIDAGVGGIKSWPTGELNREKTIDVLRSHNEWLRGAKRPQTDPRMLGLALDAAIAALTTQPVAVAPDGWRGIDSAPEGCAVLLAIEYESGRRRVLRAMRAGEKTLHLSDEQDPWDGCLYDEDEDCYYCAPGWYEKNEYDECNWAVSDKPIAWQPLPAAPANGGGCE